MMSAARSASGTLGRSHSIRRALARPLECGADEAAEERRRARGPRLELRMELARDEPRMVGQLHDLDEAALLERPGHDEPGVDEPLAEGVVHLVAVAVPLVDHRVAVELARTRPL